MQRLMQRVTPDQMNFCETHCSFLQGFHFCYQLLRGHFLTFSHISICLHRLYGLRLKPNVWSYCSQEVQRTGSGDNY